MQYYREFMQWSVANNVPVDFGSAQGYESDTDTGPQRPASITLPPESVAAGHIT